MCGTFEAQFSHMATTFDATLADYRRDCEVGKMHDTPALRVAYNAKMFIDLCDGLQGGSYLLGWYLAISMERLTALEIAGIPT